MFNILGVLFSAIALQAAPEYVVADWTFEEGTTGAPVKQTVDQSGRGHDSITIWGSPVYVAGSGSMGAVAIDCPPGGIFGSGFNVADAPDLVLTNEFTLEAAVLARYDSQGSRRVIVGRNGSYKNSYELGYYPESDQFTLAVYRPQGVVSELRAVFGRDNRFHHLAATFQNGDMKLYRDGLLAASTNTTVTPDPGSMDALSVGTIFNGGYWFNGLIDRVRISNATLSPAQFFYQPGLQVAIRTAPVISWTSVAGRSYRILREDSLSATNWTTLVSSFTAIGANSTFVDLEARADAS